MKINKIKSAIIEFIPRHTRKTFINSEEVLRFPVVTKYKYLGLWLNQKITLDDQLEHIRKKTDFIAFKLSPLLRRVSLEYRKNLWEIFAKPLFEFILPIYYIEPAEGRRKDVWRLLKRTFKRFTSLSRTTSDRIITLLCGYDLNSRSEEVIGRERERWRLRQLNKSVVDSGENADDEESDYTGELDEESGLSEEARRKLEKWSNERMRTRTNLCRGMPASLVEYSNLLTKICPHCKGLASLRMSSKHLEAAHHIRLPEVTDLCQSLTEEMRDMQGTRSLRLFYAHQKVSEYIKIVKNFIENGR